jgi:hypothetical protein
MIFRLYDMFMLSVLGTYSRHISLAERTPVLLFTAHWYCTYDSLEYQLKQQYQYQYQQQQQLKQQQNKDQSNQW